MKLIVQIPCYNEEQTLPLVVADIPRHMDGIDSVELMVIDDGSTDRTIEVARELGVHHIVRNKINMGLARSFRRGLEACLAAGADIIVNTDGDNQYAGRDIPKLLKPILKDDADIVIGDRQTDKLPHFSRRKKFMQWLGSGIVRKLAGIWVPDTVSGFRAFSLEAALRINIVSPFSYTIETVIQAGKRDMKIVSVPVATNSETRESRLSRHMLSFVFRQFSTIVRMYAMYQPLRVFFFLGSFLMIIGLFPVLKFLFLYLSGEGGGHIQSLVLGGMLVLMGFISYAAGLVADLVSFNRQLIEMTLEKTRRAELERTKHSVDDR